MSRSTSTGAGRPTRRTPHTDRRVVSCRVVMWVTAARRPTGRKRLRTRGGQCLRLIPLHTCWVHLTARHARCGLRSANRFDLLMTTRAQGPGVKSLDYQDTPDNPLPHPSGCVRSGMGLQYAGIGKPPATAVTAVTRPVGDQGLRIATSIIPLSVDHIRDFQKGGIADTGSRICIAHRGEGPNKIYEKAGRWIWETAAKRGPTQIQRISRVSESEAITRPSKLGRQELSPERIR